MNDVLFYTDTSEPQQWLIYYISQPLIGSMEEIPTVPALIRDRRKTGPTPARISASRKKDIKSFNELLMLFPMIARQMQPGLQQLFQDFEVSFQKFKPLPPPPPSPRSVTSGNSSKTSAQSSVNGDVYKQAADESEIRRSLELAIMSAIDLFQRVDQSQLNLLASSTSLTGAAVDRLIERYVAEQLHDSILFPRVCATKSVEDEELEQKILDMESVDLTQVGIPLLDRQEGRSLVRRLNRGIKSFEKIGTSKSPHAMVEHLLETAQCLTRLDDRDNQDPPISASSSNPEKATVVTMNADMLVSLLLVVVIRAKVPNLHACLGYMRNFMFADDVEQGETGYVLSTLEAVLFHIAQDHALSAASWSNERLWRSVKAGDLEAVRRLLEPGGRNGENSRSRGNSATRTGNGSEGESESGNEASESEDEASEDERELEVRGRTLTTHPIIQVHSPGVEWPERPASPPEQKAGDGPAGEIDDASSDLSELAGSGSSSPVAQDPATDDLETDRLNLDADEANDLLTTPPEQLCNGVVETPGEPEENESKVSLPAINGGGRRATLLDPFEDEAYIDPFEAAPTDRPSPRLVGVSSVRVEDLRADGQEDSDSITGTLTPVVPKAAPNPRAGTARFEFDERPSKPKKARGRSVASLATTADDTSISSFKRLSRTMTSQSQNADSFSVEKLSKTRNALGESVLMMAVQERRVNVLTYLLESPHFDTEFFAEDANNEGTSLLSAAVQAESTDIVDVLLPRLLSLPDEVQRRYYGRADSDGRTVAHYLFQ